MASNAAPATQGRFSAHQRWQWIDQDMLPAWIDHVESGTAGPLVAAPIADQAAGQRLIPDWLLSYEPE